VGVHFIITKTKLLWPILAVDFGCFGGTLTTEIISKTSHERGFFMQTQPETGIGGPNFLLRNVRDTLGSLSDPHRTQLNVVLSAFRSLRGDRRAHIGYATVPVTTGKRLYDVLLREGVLTREELVAKRGSAFVYEQVIRPNIDDSIAFVDHLGLEESRIYIAPSVFEAKPFGWTDDAYMSLWYRVIGEMTGKHQLMDGWAYSYGGVREVFFSLLLQWRMIRKYTLKEAIGEYKLENFLPDMVHQDLVSELEKMWAIRIYDKSGEVTLPQILAECARVVAELHAHGFEVGNLFNFAQNMGRMPAFSPLLYTTSVFDDPLYKEVRRDLELLRESIANSKKH